VRPFFPFRLPVAGPHPDFRFNQSISKPVVISEMLTIIYGQVSNGGKADGKDTSDMGI